MATAACNSLSGMHVQGVAGLSNGRTSAAWNVIQAAAKYACLCSTSARRRGTVSCMCRSTLYVCWYRAAVQWTTVYGRSILGAYVPDGLHGDMKGRYFKR